MRHVTHCKAIRHVTHCEAMRHVTHCEAMRQLTHCEDMRHVTHCEAMRHAARHQKWHEGSKFKSPSIKLGYRREGNYNIYQRSEAIKKRRRGQLPKSTRWKFSFVRANQNRADWPGKFWRLGSIFHTAGSWRLRSDGEHHGVILEHARRRVGRILVYCNI